MLPFAVRGITQPIGNDAMAEILTSSSLEELARAARDVVNAAARLSSPKSGWGNSAFVFALVEALAQGAAYGDIQPAAGLELVKELFLHRLDTLAVSGDVD